MRSFTWILFLSVSMMCATVAKAQIQLMPAVNVLVSDATAFGAGSISARYFVSSHVAVGLNIRYIPITRIAMTTLEVDYFFKSGRLVRPFFGLEAGVFSRYEGATYTNLGVVPEIGLQKKFSSLMGIQLDVSYPTIIRKGERLEGNSAFQAGIGLNFSIGSDK